jgi:hypothetical protein
MLALLMPGLLPARAPPQRIHPLHPRARACQPERTGHAPSFPRRDRAPPPVQLEFQLVIRATLGLPPLTPAERDLLDLLARGPLRPAPPHQRPPRRRAPPLRDARRWVMDMRSLQRTNRPICGA